jgi:hypothetical protein
VEVKMKSYPTLREIEKAVYRAMERFSRKPIRPITEKELGRVIDRVYGLKPRYRRRSVSQGQ